MRRPSNSDYGFVHAWVEHSRAWWACERMFDLIEHDQLRAWRMVQVMVAYAPDPGLLASVAAGPVEDLFRLQSLMREEAERNSRFRICLGMTYGLPEALVPFADRPTYLESLPPMNAVEATAEEIELMVAWFHHRDTGWAPRRFDELTREEPEQALFLLTLLLESAEKYYPHLRDDVFSHAFDHFVRSNFTPYRDQLRNLAIQYDHLRQWCLKHSPTSDSEAWSGLVQDLKR